MKRFRKITALFLTLLMVFSFMSMQNVYAVTELTDYEKRIISVFGELPQVSFGQKLMQSIQSLSATASVPDGVYYIKNNSTGKYFGVTDASSDTHGTHFGLESKKTANPAGNEPNRLAQLWRVTYVGGYYVLRPLHMLNMVFAARTPANIIAYDYNSTNTNVLEYAKWDLSGSTSNCKIKSDFFGDAMKATANGGLGFTSDSNDAAASWSFESAASIPSGVIVYGGDTSLTSGKTKQIMASAYSPTLSFGTVTWSTSSASLASLSQPSGNDTEAKLLKRIITAGSSSGIATLTMTSKTSTTTSANYYVAVNQLADGQYFIRNKASNSYMDITGPSTSANTALCQWSGTALDSQVWIVKFNSNDGYYTIQSLYSLLYAGVSGNSASSNAQIVQSAGGTASGQRWTISSTVRGYEIKPKCASSMAIGVNNNSSANGTTLVSKAYTPAFSDWIFSPDIYGRKLYRNVTSAIINCHGYAMAINDWPDNWANNYKKYAKKVTEDYKNNLITADSNGNFSQEITEGLSEAAKSDFEAWLIDNGYNGKFEYEANFSGNGGSRVLNSNQYRVVLRTGIHVINGLVKRDYHFWYQTFDGSWANKHGSKPSEHLPVNETPFYTNTSGWNLGSTSNFYDGIIYSYIITVS